MKTVLVFGTFDRLHPGHEDFFEQAKALGDTVIVCLTQDIVVSQLKERSPMQLFEDRKRALEERTDIAKVIAGDLEIGAFTVIDNIKPDIIAVGYDQDQLETAIKQWLNENDEKIPVIQLRPFKPEIYKSSLLKEKS